MKTTKLLLIALILSAIQLFAIDGFPGTALEFDGVNDFVDLGEPADLKLTNFTLSCWFKRTGDGVTTSTGAGGVEAEPLITKGRGEADGNNRDMNYFFGIRQTDSVLVADFEDYATGGNHVVAGVTTINSDEWYHTTVTYDGVSWRLYLNGNLEIEQTEGATPRYDSIQDNAIGSALTSSGSPSGYFNGMIEEVQIWNVARTTEEIRESINLPLTGAETGLVGYWQFNAGLGSTLTDVVGSNNGVLTNMDDTDWVDSTIPFGVGSVDAQIISTIGVVDFAGTNVSMNITEKIGTDTIIVSNINLAPNVTPPDANPIFTSQYWVIDSYGTGITTTNILFTVNGAIDNWFQTNPSYIKLYGRNSNSDTDWTYLSNAIAVNVVDSTALFSEISDFNQFVLTGNSVFPEIINLSPSDNEIDVIIDDNLEIIFDKTVLAGIGNVHIIKSSDDSTYEIIPATSVLITDSLVTINPTLDLRFQTDYYVLIDNAAFMSTDSIYYGGIDDKNTWNFTTEGILITNLSPSDNEIDIIIDNDLEITFDKNLIAGSGNIHIMKSSDDSTYEIIPATSVLITDSLVTINPTLDFKLQTGYYVLIDSTAFLTSGGQYFGGIYNKDTWNFTTGDILITSLTPLDDAINIALNSNLEITFNTDIYASSGDITIKRSTDDSIYEIISASSTEISDSTVTINPSSDFEYQTDYYVLIDSTAFMTSDNTYFKGVDNKDTWNFKAKGQFVDINAGLEGVNHGSAEWGDYDNDGDLDILLSGYSSGEYYSIIYNNNNNGIFTDINAGLQGLDYASAAWGDYDNDGDLDILLAGYNSEYCSIIYQNNNGIFTDINAELEGVSYGSVAWGDYDNDGDLDILLSGESDSAGNISLIYNNNNNGIFVDIDAGLEGVYYASAAWGDYDNDGDLDILLTGEGNFDPYEISKIYRNDSGIFTDINAGLEDVYGGSATWGDYDNDGDLDILLTGYGDSGETSKIYNNESGIFSDINAGLESVYGSSAEWGDYDNDGDLDILLSGYSSGEYCSIIYKNNNGIFMDINAGLQGLDYASAAWGDYDNDGDLDILLTGYYYDGSSNYTSNIYRNDGNTFNMPPNPPSNLSAGVNGSEITFSWDKATDNETPQNGLSYNLYIGTITLTDDVEGAMSNIGTGYRKVVSLGNTNQNTSWTIKDLDVENDYYWSVQAIDHAFAGSVFATEQYTGLGSPANVLTNINGNNLEVSWDAVIGVSYYKVYASDDPYGIFVLKDVLMGEIWTIPYTERSEFYYIKAVNGGKMPEVKKIEVEKTRQTLK